MLSPQKTIAVALVFALGTLLNAAPILRVRADYWMPFNGDPAGETPGYVVEFLREVFEPQGITVDYKIMPWTDAIKAAESGEIDAIIGTSEEEAKNLVIGKEGIAEPQFSIFVRKDNPWKYENLHSLTKVRLGAVEGYSYWPSMDGYIKKSPVPAVTLYKGDAPAAEAVAELRDGKIDAFVESVLVFVWSLKSGGQKFSDYRAAYSEPSEPLYVAFAKNEQGKQCARLLDEGLKKLKANGRFQAILDRYGFAKK